MTLLREFPQRLVILGLRAYKWLLSPMLGFQCRFYPSCSDYALGCFESYGFFRAALLSAWRVLRCHPYARGGIDPVPERGGN